MHERIDKAVSLAGCAGFAFALLVCAEGVTAPPGRTRPAPTVTEAAGGGVAQAFTRDSNAECYRPCGRGVFDKTTNRTYLVYLNRESRPWIQYYDHSLNSWAPPQQVSENTGESSQPDHLYPSLWIDAKGRIHVVYGSHCSSYRHSISSQPHDIRSWRVAPTVGSRQSYPQPVWASDGRLYLFSTHYYAGRHRELGYFLSTDGGNSFGPNQIVIEHSPLGSAYVGAIKHEPGCLGRPERFHIAWVHLRHINAKSSHGQVHPVHYCQLNLDNQHLYNAQGIDLGKQVSYPEEWDACVAASPRLSKKFMQHIPVSGTTADGSPFVIWMEEDAERMCVYFSAYDASANDWITSTVFREPDTESRSIDADVLADGTIRLYYPMGGSVRVFSLPGDGEDWSQQTIYSSPEPGQLYFAALIDSGEMLNNEARRHEDFQLTFKQFRRTHRVDRHYQFAWGKRGFLEADVEGKP